MKNISIALLIIISSFISFANTKPPRKKLSHEERIALHERIKLKMTGGYVRKENSAKGAYVILNAQKLVGSSAISKVLDTIDQSLAIKSFIKDVNGVTVDNIADLIKGANATIGVGLIDDPTHPSLLIAPESGFAIINVRKLSTNKVSDNVIESRVRKEILRVLAFTTGCAYTTMVDPLMRDVTKPSDLDALPSENFGYEILNKFSNSAPLYGLKPWYSTTYKRACEEGWAPAPTNDIQKAIWDRVHAAPKNPMKIEFDPKKGR